MRHRIKLIRFKGGRDASRMTAKKLMKNFFKQSFLITSDRKAKSIKSSLEKVITLTKEVSESNKNQLLKVFADKKMVDVLFNQVGQACASIPGGYLKVSHIYQRKSDATHLMKLEWAHPVKIVWDQETEATKSKKIKKNVKIEKSKKMTAPEEVES